MAARLKFHSEHVLIDAQDARSALANLMPETNRMRFGMQEGYATNYASLALRYDHTMLHSIAELVHRHKARHPRMLLVVGIGGSDLGVRAVQEALLGQQYNAKNPEMAVYYADSVDTQSMHDLITILTGVLRAGYEVVCAIVTKSGMTTETIANAQILFDVLRHERPESYHQSLVIITDESSPLQHLAQKKEFNCLIIPRLVGGRYSVLSAAGLFPLMMLGIDVQQLCGGAQHTLSLLGDANNENVSARSAIYSYLHYRNNRVIHDHFFFQASLEGIGRWYRQLIGESLGKERSNGVPVGITPTVSLGTNDLHSVGQLYLGGPNDKFTTFVTVRQQKSEVVVSDGDFAKYCAPYITGKSLEALMGAIVSGVQQAYADQHRPFVSLELPELNAFWLGAFLQMKMVEVIYLGYLLEVDPFNQPHVETYKVRTKRILSNA